MDQTDDHVLKFALEIVGLEWNKTASNRISALELDCLLLSFVVKIKTKCSASSLVCSLESHGLCNRNVDFNHIHGILTNHTEELASSMLFDDLTNFVFTQARRGCHSGHLNVRGSGGDVGIQA